MTQTPSPSSPALPLSGEAAVLPVTSALAMCSVVLAVVFCFPLAPLLGLILGVMGLSAIEAASGALEGRRLAAAGIWLGSIGTVFQIGTTIFWAGYYIPYHNKLERDQAIEHQLAGNQSQVASILEGLISYADDNNGHMPGIDRNGKLFAPDPETRLQILVENNFVDGHKLIIMKDQMSKHAYMQGKFSLRNFSYAVLELGHPNRLAEWKKDANSAAPLLSDRNNGKNSDSRVRSMWSNERGVWWGCVGWGDGHATVEHSAVMAQTVYNSVPHTDDNLFADEGSGDAYMIYGD